MAYENPTSILSSAAAIREDRTGVMSRGTAELTLF